MIFNFLRLPHMAIIWNCACIRNLSFVINCLIVVKIKFRTFVPAKEQVFTELSIFLMFTF